MLRNYTSEIRCNIKVIRIFIPPYVLIIIREQLYHKRMNALVTHLKIIVKLLCTMARSILTY
jgi:hypothetical protein